MSEKRNDVYIGGVSCLELAKKVSTPLYVFDESKIEKQLNDFKKYFTSDEISCDVIYASKAFTCKAMVELVKKHNCSLDVVSGGELYVAKAIDFPMNRIYFHGNNKTLKELKMALDLGVGTIVLDNPMELDALLKLTNEMKKEIHTLIRVNPGIEAHTHKYIVTAHIDSKFGISIQDKETLVDMITKMNKSEYVKFDGFHAHIGSQIFDMNAYIAEIETLMSFVNDLRNEYDIHMSALNLGGGFAAYYTSADHPIPLNEVCNGIVDTVLKERKKYGLNIKKIMIEPGRSIVANAGSTLYEVGYIKKTKNKKYVFVDGGMSDNIRPALYQADYSCDIVNKIKEVKNEKVCVAGKCCESGDILIEEIMLPKAESGDILIIYTTGAYGYSMASNYNKLARPAVVFTKDGKARIVVERENFEDMISNDCDKEIF